MKCTSDDEFGPIVVGPDGATCAFDFTVTFESAFFALAPSILVLPIIGFRVWGVFQQTKVVDWASALVAKSAFYIALGALQLGELGLYGSNDTYARSELALPASAFIFVAIVALAVLSLLEHSRSPRPAPIIQSYLLLTLLFDAARLRTRWIEPGELRIASLQSASFAVKFLILIVESLTKDRHFVPPPGTIYSPEGKAGLFSRSFLLWLGPLFVKGYRTKLKEDDLYPVDDDLGTEKLTEAVDFAWNHTSPTRRRRLALSLVRAFAWQLFLIQLPRLVLVGFAIAQPFLVHAALGYVNNHKTLPIEFGYGLIGAFGLIYVGVAISTLWYQHLTFRLLVMVRGSLIRMVFRHNLKLPASESGGSASTVSLMSTDMERIQQTLQWVLNVGPAVVQVGLGLWILSDYLGAVSVAPLIVALACSLIVTRVGKNIPPRQRRWMQAIQNRVGVTTNAIGYIKGVKMSNLSERIADQIQGFRVSEMENQKAFRRLQITNITIGQTPMELTPAVTFAAFAIAQKVGGGSQFQAEAAFTALALLSILISPIAELVAAAVNMASALSCLDRIQEYLQKEPQQDSRSLPPPPPTSNQEEASTERGVSTGFELQTFGDMAIRHQPGPTSARQPLARITNGTFGWDTSKPIIQDIDMGVSPSKLIMIIGPVGVGKSTLLRSLLGETRILSGTVDCSSPKQIAYCDQEPWILNLSIKQNILGISECSDERYRRVIEACQLRTDFDQLPEGDETLTGSKGLSLSGGQRQRISLARAAYSGKQLIIMDNTLSGLDADTSLKCFHALLGDSGLFRQDGRAAVFATHNAQWLPYADEIIVLGAEGRITARGDYDSLKASCDYVRELQVAQNSIYSTGESSQELVISVENVTGLTAENPIQPSPKQFQKDSLLKQKQKKNLVRSTTFGIMSLQWGVVQCGCSLYWFCFGWRVILHSRCG